DHSYPADHSALNAPPAAVLNVSRESMARYGFSPATRVFEAAGAAACILTDHWAGIDFFFEPDKESWVSRSGAEVQELLGKLSETQARQIGEAAYARVLNEHTYARRAEQLE